MIRYGPKLAPCRETKAPFDPALKLNQAVKRAAMARGVIVYPMPGTIDGVNGDHVVLAPPYTATDAEIDEIVDVMAAAVPEALPAVVTTVPAELGPWPW